MLGQNKEVERRNSVQFIFTINEGVFSSDLITRSVPVELSLTNKDESKHSFDPVEYFRENRSVILSELLGLVESDRRANDFVPRFSHSKFPRWSKLIGSIMESNNYKCFLGNVSSFKASRDDLLSQILHVVCTSFSRSHKVNLTFSPMEMVEMLAIKNVEISSRSLGQKLTKLIGADLKYEHDDEVYKLKLTKVKSNRGGNNCDYRFEKCN